MFESAEIGHVIDKETYDREAPALREALLEAQYELQQQKRSAVIVLINGIEGAGKGETVKLLSEWMDPRLIEVRTFDSQTDEELAHPPAWRYWRQLPAKGRMGVFFGNWYSQMLQGRVHGLFKNAVLDQAIAGAERLEKMLCNEGAVIFKFWFHLSKKQMKERLQTLKDDPLHSWRISPLDWQQSKTYDKFVRYGERAIRRTSRDYAPWNIVEGMDPHYRSLTVGRILLDGLQAALQTAKVAARPAGVPPLPDKQGELTLLDCLDMSQHLEKDDYQEQLITEQARLSGLMRDKRMRRHSLIAVFEGNDAAGKGGSIRRVAAALDPRQYSIVPIAAPSEDERAQPYLWRFWRQVPARGKFTIFDRSWYGRVLVERVEGFCTEADWMRAYGEINEFEAQMDRHHLVVVKFWLAITKDEQLRRFEERQKIAFKTFKITEEDWRNREKWADYEHAVCDMVDRTSTLVAPWTLVEANDKNFARIKVLKTLCARIEERLERLRAENVDYLDKPKKRG